MAAKLYSEKFVGRNYIFVFRTTEGGLGCIEVAFPVSAFKHLTGIKTGMKPNDFFEACVNGKLPLAIINEKIELAEIKLSVLPNLLDTTYHRVIGEFIPSGIYIETEKLSGNNFACLGFDRKSGARFYFPKTVLKEDIRKRVYKPYKIEAILSKAISEDTYTSTHYISKNTTLEQIDELIKAQQSQNV
jgi:hypothetical protein